MATLPLFDVLFSFYKRDMPDSSTLPVSVEAIASAVLSAPTLTRLGLACPNDQLRERAANDLALEIVARLTADAGQLPLAL